MSNEKEHGTLDEHKKEKPRLVRLIRKSNDLVEGKYRLDIWEMRVFTKTLTMIHKDDEDFRPYRIYLKDIISEFGLDQNKQSYKFLKEGAEKLARREIRVIASTTEGEMELLTHIAAGVKSFTNNNAGKYIEVSFHPEMKPHLLQLQSQFLMYDIKNILRLQSSFSIRIYELLKQYERIGRRKFTLDELKEILDVSDKYALYANFKQRVIIKAQEDLADYTDIRFTFEEEKRNKAVYAIIFTIERNRDFNEEHPPIANADGMLNMPIILTENKEIFEVLELLKPFKGVNKQTVEEWLNQFPLDYIRQRIILLKNQIALGGKVHNPMGYLQKLMTQTNVFSPIFDNQEEKQKVAQDKANKQQEVSSLLAELENLEKKYNESQTNLVDQLIANNQNIKREIMDQVQNSPFYDRKLSIDQNMNKGMIQGMVFNTVKEQHISLFNELDNKYQQEVLRVKQQLKLLGKNI